MLLRRQFREDVASGVFQVFAIGDSQFSSAEELIDLYSMNHRLRTLDALQVAVALGLRKEGLIDHFVSADQVLCDIAGKEGFSVLNPENS